MSIYSSWDEELSYFRSLFGESDRGCVILTLSRLEEELKELHICYIELNGSLAKADREKLFSGFGPLSSLSARIKLGGGYGLIARETMKDLDVMRAVRNSAAHSAKPFNFASDETRKAIVAIHAPRRMVQEFGSAPPDEQLIQALKDPTSSVENTKMYWLCSGMAVGVELKTKTLAYLKHRSEKLSGAR